MKMVIVRGLPGSGKSTIAKQLIGNEVHIKHFEADMYFMSNGAYIFDHTRLKEVHQQCQADVKSALLIGYDVVVSNTFVKKWEIEPYLLIAKDIGCDVEVIVATGEYSNVHGVPKEVIERMKSNWES